MFQIKCRRLTAQKCFWVLQNSPYEAPLTVRWEVLSWTTKTTINTARLLHSVYWTYSLPPCVPVLLLRESLFWPKRVLWSDLKSSIIIMGVIHDVVNIVFRTKLCPAEGFVLMSLDRGKALCLEWFNMRMASGANHNNMSIYTYYATVYCN